MSSRLYPIGIQNFEKIRKEGYLYIDKTALIHQMVTTGSYYFLSRPRRFGKSLLVSTIEAYFQGKKDLFEGLAMAALEKEWLEHPIFHLDLNISKYASATDLVDILDRNVAAWEELYGNDPAERSLPLRFAGVILRAYKRTGRRVVILVDEYDKPLLQTLHDEALQEEMRSTLKPFYGVLKTMDGCIRFALLTGVTKFGKVSVFSDLNNLEDISMLNAYADICGVTDVEIRGELKEDVQALADALGLEYEAALARLKENYDGYHFTPNAPGVYNPFSLLNTFKNRQFGDYWFETGTPTYLVELLKRTKYDLYDMAHTETSADVLNSIDATSYNPIPVIYQSGYLTIKDYDSRFGYYTLGFPNREVEEGFVKYLLPFYANVNATKSAFEIGRFVQSVERGDVDNFLERLQSFFADTPYELARDLELHYQNVLFIVFRLVGLYTQVEYHTNRGRIDLVLKTDRYIYIMEFKLDGTAEEALRQIDDKGYAEPFAHDGREIIKVGVNFSSSVKNIERWVVAK